MKVRSYGRLADVLGTEREVRIDVPCTIAELRQQLATEFPEAAGMVMGRRVLACVGDAIVADSHVVTADEGVELLPPVSGG